MSENLLDIKKSELTMDSKILDMELCTDGDDNWTVRVKEDYFLLEDGTVEMVGDDESIPQSAIYSSVIKAQQVAQREGEDIDVDGIGDEQLEDAFDEDQVEKSEEESSENNVFDEESEQIEASEQTEQSSDTDSSEQGSQDEDLFSDDGYQDEMFEEDDDISEETTDEGGIVASVKSLFSRDQSSEEEQDKDGEIVEEDEAVEHGGTSESDSVDEDAEMLEDDLEIDEDIDESQSSGGIVASIKSVFGDDESEKEGSIEEDSFEEDSFEEETFDDIEPSSESDEQDHEESSAIDKEPATDQGLSADQESPADQQSSAFEDSSYKEEGSEGLDDQSESMFDEESAVDESSGESFMDKVESFISPEIEDVDQKRPDARNVSIDFVGSNSESGFWSNTMQEFWGKLRKARQGETEAVKDINSDLWTRYKALIVRNEYARGDIADAFVGIFLVVLGVTAILAGFASLFLGNVASLDVLTQESGYADHIFITTILLFLTGLSFWLSRRTNSKTIVSAIRKPARGLEFTVVTLQIVVIGVVMYMLTLGGGQEGLGVLEQSITQSVISVVSMLPTSVSDPAVSAIQSYRGPESVTGFSIVEASALMVISGLLIAYPVLKRSLARFVLTANMGAREFREETGILVEEISDGSDSEFDEPEYVLGGSSEDSDGRAVTKEMRGMNLQDEEAKEGLIALPDHIRGSPFADYEEVRRYWVRAPYAYVSIVYDERQNDYRYVVVEPELDETEKVLFDELKTRLDNVLLFEDVEEYEDHEKEVQAKLKKLEKRMIELTEEYEIDINDETFHRLMYFIERDYVYYNKIDPLINDPNVEDISCDGEDQYIFIFHSDYKDVISNVKFGREELRSFIQELAQRSGEHISAADPMVDASLPDGSRAQMTLGSEVTTHGSTFTIRLFEDIPFTPVDLLDYDTFSLKQMAYLWTAIEHNKSLIFAGGTASGKTTSMNAVSMFIPPKAKVITIEDTREISLPQKNWIPGTTREGVSGEEGGDDIDMYELLRAALRQRPEYIVVGEIRGREAETLFQAMNTGHTTYSTMHAETVDAAIGRLTNPPINVPKQMITALDIICIQNQIRFTDDEGNQINVRRNEETREIVSLRDNGQFDNRRPFQWDAETDTFIESLEDSHVLERVANENGWTPDEKRSELKHRAEVLGHMVENDIREFDYVTNIIQAYMVDPEKILREVRNDTLDPENLKSLTDMEWDSPEVEPETTLNETMEGQTPEQGDTQ